MENASKALIMAAEILVGVMIISIGVYLFNTLGQYSADTAQDMEQAQIDSFNEQFLRYYGMSAAEREELSPIKSTMHDIVGLANLAAKINAQNGFTEIEPVSDNSSYIQIDVKIGTKTYKNLEAYSQDELVNLVKNYSIVYSTDSTGSTVAETKYYKVPEQPTIGKYTKLVNYVKFVEI